MLLLTLANMSQTFSRHTVVISKHSLPFIPASQLSSLSSYTVEPFKGNKAGSGPGAESQTSSLGYRLRKIVKHSNLFFVFFFPALPMDENVQRFGPWGRGVVNTTLAAPCDAGWCWPWGALRSLEELPAPWFLLRSLASNEGGKAFVPRWVNCRHT